MPTLTNLDLVFVPVRDMAVSFAFYRDVLGLEPTAEGPYWSSFRVGDVTLALHGPSDPSLAEPTGGWTVCLACDDLVGLRGVLAKAGVWMAPEDHQTPRGPVLSFQDPDGNPLQAIFLMQD